MQGSLPLGPVESDTAHWEQVALIRFRKDSTLARKKCDSLFAPVSEKQFYPFDKIPPPKSLESVPSFLAPHQLHPSDYGKIRPSQGMETWVSVILVVSLLIASLIRWRYFNRVKTLADAFFLNRFVSQIVREENVFLNRVNLLLSILYILIVSLFSYLSMNVLGIHLIPSLSPLQLFFLIGAALTGIFVVKMLVILISGFIFDQSRAAAEYVFSIFLYNQMAAIMLIPILVALLYTQLADPYYLVLAGAALLVFFYLFRLFRIVTGGLASPSVSVYYLFLYLCTLEILPAAVALKLVTG